MHDSMILRKMQYLLECIQNDTLIKHPALVEINMSWHLAYNILGL